MEKKEKLYHTIGTALLIALLLVLALFTLHDVATAKGIGLYFSLLSGQRDKYFYDILFDICGMAALLLVLTVPFFLLRHRTAKAFLRLTVLYFAFMPVLDLATLVHLPDGHPLFVVAYDWERGTTFLSTHFREILPGILIVLHFYREKDLSLKLWHKILLTFVGVLAVIIFFEPELAELAEHISGYLLVVLAFDWWEEAAKEEASKGSLPLEDSLPSECITARRIPRPVSEKVTEVILFALLYAHGVLKMAELMMRHVV